MNPLSRLLQEHLPALDVGVMAHGFAAHNRDYVFVLENSFGPVPGTYRLTFTHVVELSFISTVGDDVWQRSWTDDFIDYERWEAAGEPDGYVFGTTGRLPIRDLRPLMTTLALFLGPPDLNVKCMLEPSKQTVLRSR